MAQLLTIASVVQAVTVQFERYSPVIWPALFGPSVQMARLNPFQLQLWNANLFGVDEAAVGVTP